MILKEAALYPDRPIPINPVWQGFAVVNLAAVFAAIATTTKRLGVPNVASPTFADWLNVVHSEVFERKLNITSEAMEIIKRAKVVPFGGRVGAARLGFAGASDNSRFPQDLPSLFGLVVFSLVLLVLFGLSIFSLILLPPFGLVVFSLGLPPPFGLVVFSPDLLVLFGLVIFSPGLPSLFGLVIFSLGSLALFRLGIFSPNLLAPFGLSIFSLDLLALFGLSIFLLGLLVLFGLVIFSLGSLALFGLSIFSPNLLVLFGLLILPYAHLTLTSQPILFRFILMKLPNRLSLIALTTRLNHFAASSFISVPKLYIGSGSV